MSRTAFISSNAEIYRRLKNLEEKVKELQPIEPEEEDFPEGNKYVYTPLDRYREYAPMQYDEDIDRYALYLDKDSACLIERFIDEYVGLVNWYHTPITVGNINIVQDFLGYDYIERGVAFKRMIEGEVLHLKE